MNYFIEGLQGSGKSTLAGRLAALDPSLTAVGEGDYSPVELAWCAYMTQAQYRAALEQYPALRGQMEALSRPEGDRRVLCYTKVRTEDRAFYGDMERYELYNGRVPWAEFRRIVLGRYAAWQGDGAIYECSLFQNTVEDMILYRQASDEEILAFYREVRDVLAAKPWRVLYLETADIPGSIGAVSRERVDENGAPVWFRMLLEFFDGCPWAAARGLSGEAALLDHLAHRQALELRICRELFPDRVTVLPSKAWGDADADRILGR